LLSVRPPCLHMYECHRNQRLDILSYKHINPIRQSMLESIVVPSPA